MKKRIPYLTITALLLCLLSFLFLFLEGITDYEMIKPNGYILIFGGNYSTKNLDIPFTFNRSIGLIIAFILMTMSAFLLTAYIVHKVNAPDKNKEFLLSLKIISAILLFASGILYFTGEFLSKSPSFSFGKGDSYHLGFGFVLTGASLISASLFLLFDLLLQTKAREFVKSSTGGMLIGVACLIPGVSGGTIAVMLGIYKKIVESVGNILKNFKSAILYLLPVAVGTIIAILVCWYPFNLLMKNAMLATVGLFAGLVIGGIPSIFKNIKGVKRRAPCIVGSILSCVSAVGIGVISIIVSELVQTDIILNMFTDFNWYLYIIIIFVGALAAIALIVPGISGSLVLLVLGFYKPILGLVDNFKSGTNIGQSIGVLLLFLVGVVIGFFSFSKFMNYLLEKHHDTTYFVIIGFIIGSIIAIFVNSDMFSYIKAMIVAKSIWEWIISPILLVLGAVGIYFLTLYAEKKELKESTAN